MPASQIGYVEQSFLFDGRVSDYFHTLPICEAHGSRNSILPCGQINAPFLNQAMPQKRCDVNEVS